MTVHRAARSAPWLPAPPRLESEPIKLSAGTQPDPQDPAALSPERQREQDRRSARQLLQQPHPKVGAGRQVSICKLPVREYFQLGRGDLVAASSSPPPRCPGRLGGARQSPRGGGAAPPPASPAGRFLRGASSPPPTSPSAPQT
ncbi:uncharacterized protein LOC144367252 [Ictidomys tridecemlineatus]